MDHYDSFSKLKVTIIDLTLTIVGRSRANVSSHQDVFQTFGFPESQDGWFFEDIAQFWVFFVLIANIIPNYSKGNYYVMGCFQQPMLLNSLFDQFWNILL
jgi:hypothetical protein